MNNTGIDWTDLTWNPATGCTKISAGCRNCYAEALALRLERMGNPGYLDGFAVRLHPERLEAPLREKKPRMVFVNSMSDLLHSQIPDEFISACFATMRKAHWHTFQILTKRADRWPDVARVVGEWPVNAWAGVSVEDRKHLDRLKPLSEVPGLRFVSFEPLLEDVGPADALAGVLVDAGIKWVISGGESGWHSRPAAMEWFETIRDACDLAGVPLYHKQHGGRGTTHAAKRAGSLATIGGKLYNRFPDGRQTVRASAASHPRSPQAGDRLAPQRRLSF